MLNVLSWSLPRYSKKVRAGETFAKGKDTVHSFGVSTTMQKSPPSCLCRTTLIYMYGSGGKWNFQTRVGWGASVPRE